MIFRMTWRQMANFESAGYEQGAYHNELGQPHTWEEIFQLMGFNTHYKPEPYLSDYHCLSDEEYLVFVLKYS